MSPPGVVVRRVLVPGVFVGWAFAVSLGACGCAGRDPRAAAYAAERLACVKIHSTADRARACMHDVDESYRQDGGAP